MTRTIAILGAGNVGCAMAAQLELTGTRVRLYSPFAEELAAIDAAGGIHLTGVVAGCARPHVLTADLAEAVRDAPMIVVAVPGFAHRAVGVALAPVLVDGQTVLFQPGVFGSALEAAHMIGDANPRLADIRLAETETSVYTCRLSAPGHVRLVAMKHKVAFGVLPQAKTEDVATLLAEYFDDRLVPRADTLTIGLSNANPVYHCPPAVLNFSDVEQGIDQPLHGLVTPGIANVMDALDQERVALARAFGILIPSFWDYLVDAYGVAPGSHLSRLLDVYSGPAFPAPASVEHRYFTEDIPFGLVPWASLGRLVGVPTPITDMLITAATTLTGRDWVAAGRTAESLNIPAGSAAQIAELFAHGPAHVSTGSRP